MKTPDPQIAQPRDPLYSDKYFLSDDLTFIASCLLNNSLVVVKSVTLHPSKIGIKVYGLFPKDKVVEFRRAFNDGLVMVNPQFLGAKIYELKRLPLSPTNDDPLALFSDKNPDL